VREQSVGVLAGLNVVDVTIGVDGLLIGLDWLFWVVFGLVVLVRGREAAQ
jgi:hypothetical protein